MEARNLRLLAQAISFLALSSLSLADLPVDWYLEASGNGNYVNTTTVGADGVLYVTFQDGADVVTTAIAPDGTTIWTEADYANGGALYGASLAPGGRHMAAGWYPTAGKYDLLVLVRDAASGALVQSIQYGSATVSESGTIATGDASGAVYAGGSIAGDGGDALVVKFDAGGQPVWQRTWDGTADGVFSTDGVLDLRLDPAGDLLALVRGFNAGQKQDYVVLKYDADTGATLWEAQWGDAGDEVPCALRIDAAGDVYVSGTKNGKRFATVKWRGADGALLWQAFDAVQQSMRANAMELDGAGGLIVTGHADPDLDSSNNNENAYTVKRRASDGAVLWTSSFGDDCEDCYESAGSLHVGQDGRIALGVVTPWKTVVALLLDSATGVVVDRGMWTSPGWYYIPWRIGRDAADGLVLGLRGFSGYGAVHFGAPTDCPATVYCDEAQNPANAADISITGCDLSAPVFVTLENAPPSQFCYLLVGDLNGVVSTPPGSGGDLCVAGGSCMGRYSKDIGPTTLAGSYATDLEDSASGGPGFGIPTCGGAIQAGETWYFQYWHRRPGGQPSSFSSALAVTFR